MWAVGVLAYILLTGVPPFNGKTEAEIFKKIRFCDYDFPDELWKDISEEAQKFIIKLLQPDPKKRLDPAQALNEKWLQFAPVENVLHKSVLDRLKNFRTPKKLVQEFLFLLVQQIDEEMLLKNKETF